MGKLSWDESFDYKRERARGKRCKKFRTRSVALGRLRISSIDNIGEALSNAEGEAFK
jgi:hypothetical protein